ncbi:MAG: hypothetical protein R3275_02705 [Saprospiraceae bacterium]|nr:hypothetical protein [Saprospiraceae bacterium]
MNQLIITSGVVRPNAVKTYCRKRLTKALGDKNVKSCFCRMRNQFSIYGVELVVELYSGDVLEVSARHFYVQKAFDLGLYFLSKKMHQLGLVSDANTSDFIQKSA